MNTLIISCVSIVIILLALSYILMHPFIKEGSRHTKNIVAISIGVMLTILITHLLPEVYSEESSIYLFSGITVNSLVFLFSLVCFYMLGWVSHNHEHDEEHVDHSHKSENSMPVMFIGQSVHSIADGVVIASSFAINIYLGIITTIAISLHHIPMMSGVVIRNNKSDNFKKLFCLTIFSSSFMFIGAVLFYFIKLSDMSSILLAVSAASFLYVGAYDLTSYLREYEDKNILKRVMFIFLGVAIGIATQIFNVENIIDKEEGKKDTPTQSISDTRVYINSTTTQLIASTEYPKDNIFVKDWILEKYNDFASSSNRVMDEYDSNPYYWEANYSIVDSSEYMSYIYSIYNFTGGAHGSLNILPYTINKNTNSKIEKLSDIYNLEIYDFLENYSRQDLKKQFVENGADSMTDEKWLEEGTKSNPENYNSFWFNGPDLIIHFGQYQVAPYAAGMYQVYIPLIQLENYKK